jgi:hypothetical protein
LGGVAFAPSHDYCGIAISPVAATAVVAGAALNGRDEGVVAVLDLSARKVVATYPFTGCCVAITPEARARSSRASVASRSRRPCSTSSSFRSARVADREHDVDARRRHVEAALETTTTPAIASPFANFMAPQMPDPA